MRLFTDVIGDLESGRVAEDLTAALHEVVMAVQATGRAGKLTLTLSIRPNGDDSVFITPSVKPAAPEPARAVTTFYLTAGGITRRDPRQGEIPFREVAAADEQASA